MAASKRRVGVRYLPGGIDTRSSLDRPVTQDLVASWVHGKAKVVIEVSEKIPAGEEQATQWAFQAQLLKM